MITSGTVTTATATALVSGVDKTVLFRSLALSILAFSKSWYEHIKAARERGYFNGGEIPSGMASYLRDQLQMGAGLPMNAIESGETKAWKSPFRPTSVAQLEVLCTPVDVLARVLASDQYKC